MTSRSTPLNLLVLLTIASLIVLLVATPPSHASSVFTVNSTEDGIDFTPGNGVCATDVTGMICTLRAAIMETNARPGADTIILPAGTYTLSVPQPALAGADAGPGERNGDLDINDDLTLLGAGAKTTMIVGASDFNDRILDIQPARAVGLSNLTIRGGKTVGDSGGGLDNEGALTIADSVIADNHSVAVVGPPPGMVTSGGNAGGIRNSGTLTIRNTTLNNNTADADGGALFNIGGQVTLLNVTLSGNRAGGDGGAIVNSDGPTTAAAFSVANSTLASNTAPNGNGGALRNRSGSLTFKNTIVSNNTSKATPTSPVGRNCSNAGTLVSAGYNLENANSCAFTTSTDLFGLDPQLSALADNGGQTTTHALPAGSMAVDAGDPAVCAPVDQRGFGRPADGNGDGVGRCDIGAFEFNAQLLDNRLFMPLLLVTR